MNVSKTDFDHFKYELEKDKSYKEEQYDERIDPDLILSYYEGSRKVKPDSNEYSDNELERISLNKIFPSTQTLISTLYPANPSFTCKGKRQGQDEYSALIAGGALNYYFKEMNALYENQLAILNAWLFGFGCIKQGWRTVFKRPEPTKIDTDSNNKGLLDNALQFMGIGQEPDSNIEEQNPEEFVYSSEPFLYCVPNKDIIFDRTQPFNKGKRITQILRRNLYQVKSCGLYETDEDFIARFKNRKDDREVPLTLYEMYISHKNGNYLLVMCEGWDQPLRFQKYGYMAEGTPFQLLRLNIDPVTTYPVAHMKAAQRIHRELDYILSLQLMHIRKHRSIDLFHKDSLDTTAINALRNNEIGGYGFTKQPPATVHSHIGSNTIPPDLFNMQQILMSNLQEILTITGARLTGESENDTATQEKIADYGNQLRSATMQDQVLDFIKRQGKKLLQDIKQFGEVEALIQITGMNLRDPQTGQLVTEKWVEFPAQQGLETVQLKEAIQGEYDVDTDVTNIARRDIGLIRHQMEQMMALLTNPNIVQMLAMEGKKINVGELIKDTMKNFETIGNPEKYIEDIPQQPMLPPQAGGGQGMVRPEDIPQEVVDQAMAQDQMRGGVPV